MLYYEYLGPDFRHQALRFGVRSLGLSGFRFRGKAGSRASGCRFQSSITEEAARDAKERKEKDRTASAPQVQRKEKFGTNLGHARTAPTPWPNESHLPSRHPICLKSRCDTWFPRLGDRVGVCSMRQHKQDLLISLQTAGNMTSTVIAAESSATQVYQIVNPVG